MFIILIKTSTVLHSQLKLLCFVLTLICISLIQEQTYAPHFSYTRKHTTFIKTFHTLYLLCTGMFSFPPAALNDPSLTNCEKCSHPSHIFREWMFSEFQYLKDCIIISKSSEVCGTLQAYGFLRIIQPKNLLYLLFFAFSLYK